MCGSSPGSFGGRADDDARPLVLPASVVCRSKCRGVVEKVGSFQGARPGRPGKGASLEHGKATRSPARRTAPDSAQSRLPAP